MPTQWYLPVVDFYFKTKKEMEYYFNKNLKRCNKDIISGRKETFTKEHINCNSDWDYSPTSITTYRYKWAGKKSGYVVVDTKYRDLR